MPEEVTLNNRKYRIPKKEAKKRYSDYNTIQEVIDKELIPCFSTAPGSEVANELINAEIVKLNAIQYKLDPGRYGANEWTVTKDWEPTIR